jgi:hypothetical protein
MVDQLKAQFGERAALTPALTTEQAKELINNLR